VRAPQVLILDEATGALDGRTRDLVVANLRTFMRDGILVFITHEESLAAAADVVLTLGGTAPQPDSEQVQQVSA
jgi:ABC-type bacteriocin/lantibiotic exporter with double-glycine peptidase domain